MRLGWKANFYYTTGACEKLNKFSGAQLFFRSEMEVAHFIPNLNFIPFISDLKKVLCTCKFTCFLTLSSSLRTAITPLLANVVLNHHSSNKVTPTDRSPLGLVEISVNINVEQKQIAFCTIYEN